MNVTKLYTIAVALLLGLPVARADEHYTTLNEAAVAGLTAAEALTDAYEAGGTVYRCGDTYILSPVTTDHEKASLAVSVYTITGCTLAGLFHTHPRGDGRFSSTDVAGACALNTVSFIKPKSGAIRAFDCTGFSDAAKRVALTRPITGKVIS